MAVPGEFGSVLRNGTWMDFFIFKREKSFESEFRALLFPLKDLRKDLRPLKAATSMGLKKASESCMYHQHLTRVYFRSSRFCQAAAHQ